MLSSTMPALTVLRIRDFRVLWATRFIHEVSRRMELLVLGYLILKLTDSVFQVGLIAVFLNAPRPVLAMFAGTIADRLDRRRVMIGAHACYLGIASVLLALLIIGSVQPWHIYLAILLQGTARVLDDPCRRTALFDVTGESRIATAMSLEAMGNDGGKILGPLTGGILITAVGFAGAYAVLTGLDVLSLLMMVQLRLPHHPRTTRLARSVWFSLWEGFRHSLTNRMVLGVLCMALILNALVYPMQYFIPVIASDLLKVGPTLGGLLGSAEGVGTFIGASIIATRRNIRHHGRIYVVGTVIAAVAVMLVGWSRWFPISFALLVAAGMAAAFCSTMQSTILLLASTPELRGRAVGSQGMVNGIGHLVGTSEIGAIAKAFDIGVAISINAAAALLFLIPVVILTPLVRRQVGGGPESGEPLSRRHTPVT